MVYTICYAPVGMVKKVSVAKREFYQKWVFLHDLWPVGCHVPPLYGQIVPCGTLKTFLE